jgi:GT2 family glycosyltransferase
MAFWLVMIKKTVFDKIGILDEVFSPGMGEDGDFCIRAELFGYNLVAVPDDVTGEFDTGIKAFNFPIYHVGNGTFADEIAVKNEVIERNSKILSEKYGANSLDVTIVIPTYNHFEDAFKPCIDAVLRYTNLSNKEIIVVANGCTDGTRNYLDSLVGKVQYIWFDEPTGVVRAYNAGISRSRGKYTVMIDNDSILIEQEIDTWINILKRPFLEQEKVGGTSPFANEYEDMGFVLHSGCTMYNTDLLKQIGMFDEIYNPGYFCDPDVSMKIWRAGYRCVEVPIDRLNKPYKNGAFEIMFPVVHMGTVQTMDKHKDIEIVKKNREILYNRYGKTNMIKYSIVIPTYNHCDDLLRPCIESIVRYTDLENVEIIVVANGCSDNTKEYLSSLATFPVKMIWIDEPIGYTKATNEGIKVACGEFIILLNNDTELLEYPKNAWLQMMEEHFTDSSVGLVGPLQLHDNYADADVLIFFCVMIRKEVFDKIGLLDEIFSPGGGEDIDFTIRANKAGYKSVVATPTEFDTIKSTNTGGIPIWHKDNKTFKDIPEYTNYIVKRNGLINCKRYNKDIKLNIGGGGIHHPGFLSVDLYDKRADILMDITKLDFEDNSVSEIIASHVFEHLNPYHSLNILQEWRRVLKPGCKLAMEMPDIEQLCKRFVTATTGERYGILNAIYGSVNTTGEGGPDNITSPHLFGWWPQSIHDHLHNAGFRNITFMDEQWPHPESNLRVEAIK